MNDDQMLAYIDDADAGLIPKAGLAPVRDHMKALMAERDRLRAIVEVAQELRRLADDATKWRGYGPVNRAHEALFAAVDALNAEEGT